MCWLVYGQSSLVAPKIPFKDAVAHNQGRSTLILTAAAVLQDGKHWWFCTLKCCTPGVLAFLLDPWQPEVWNQLLSFCSTCLSASSTAHAPCSNGSNASSSDRAGPISTRLFALKVVHQLLLALANVSKKLQVKGGPVSSAAHPVATAAAALQEGVPAAAASSRPIPPSSSPRQILLQLEPVLVYQVLPAAVQCLCLLPAAHPGVTSFSEQHTPRTPVNPHVPPGATPSRCHIVNPQSPWAEPPTSTTAAASAQSNHHKEYDRYLKAHSDARAALGLLLECLRVEMEKEMQRVVAEVVEGTWKGVQLQGQAAGASTIQQAAGAEAEAGGHTLAADAVPGGAQAAGTKGPALLVNLALLLHLGLPPSGKKKSSAAAAGAAPSPSLGVSGAAGPGSGSLPWACLDAATEASFALSGLDTWGLLVQLLGQSFTGELAQHMLHVSGEGTAAGCEARTLAMQDSIGVLLQN